MSRTIAFFDFDGTLTTKDSFLEVIKFQKGNFSFYLGFVLLLPIMVLYKLKLIANWKAKEMVLTYFFGGTLLTDFQKASDQFANQEINRMLRSEAMKKLQWHKKEGHRIIVVSASVSNWIKSWTDKEKLELISSELLVSDSKITGKLKGNNCYGIEKAIQINARIDLTNYDDIYAYGDTSGDREMLALATKPFFRKFE